jgi:hypothetical protein
MFLIVFSIKVLWFLSLPNFTSKFNLSWAPVAHTYNPTYSGSQDQEDHSSKPAQAKEFVRPYLEQIYHKKGLVEWLKV